MSNHYTLCNSFLQEQKNWLQSPLIDVQRIDRVTVSVKYTIAPFCSSQPSNRFCTDNIEAYVWESVLHVTTDLIPDPLASNSSYREIATIRGQASDQTISLALQLTKRYIVLGFLDQGGCKILSSVRITYNICPATTLHESLVDLRKTLAPFSVFEPILVEGKCTADSFHIQGSLNVTCESSGQWNVSQFKGKCVCKEDKENVGGTCTGMFRNQSDHDNHSSRLAFPIISGVDWCLSMTLFSSPICHRFLRRKQRDCPVAFERLKVCRFKAHFSFPATFKVLHSNTVIKNK